MFGYVNIDKPELRLKDYEIYRGIYCSLCKTLGKEYSLLARFILNYDCTFLSLFILSRSEGCCGFKEGRCSFNPMKKCSYLKESDRALSKGAALTIISSYYKLLDSIHDGSFVKKLGCTLIRPVFSHWHNKALKKFPVYENAVREMFYSQLECEARVDAFLDIAAEPTAKMLSTVFKAEAKDKSEEAVFSEFGYHLGRWIYLMDAANDIKEDIKGKNFNPFLLKYKREEDIDIKEVDAVISQSYYRLTKAYELIDIKRFKDISDNIIYRGLAVKQRKTLFSGEEKCNE